MKNKILIGITTSKRSVDVNFLSKQEITYISNSIIELFQSHENVIPVILSHDTHNHHTDEICSILDGLLLSSGEDIDPSFYKTSNQINYDDKVNNIGKAYHRPKSLEPNQKRDQFEINLYHAAKKRNIPILGICRGMQLINVAEGGTLHQENPESHISHFIEKDGWIHYHNIEIDKNSKTYSILSTENIPISSIHHQSINNLGKELKATATAPDGTIEIIEHPDKEFIIGIQGHMEKILSNFPIYKKVIDEFLHAATRRSALCPSEK